MPYRLDPDNPRCIQRRPYNGDLSWETVRCFASTEIAERHIANLRDQIHSLEARILDVDPTMATSLYRSAPAAIAKVDEDEQLVFGWFNVSVTKDGRELIDLHGDMIEATDLEKAAYDFVLESREGGEMHQGDAKAVLVESFFVTPEKLESMGLPRNLLPPRWWGGFKVDQEVFAKVKDGTYKMFSVQGKAMRQEVV